VRVFIGQWQNIICCKMSERRWINFCKWREVAGVVLEPDEIRREIHYGVLVKVTEREMEDSVWQIVDWLTKKWILKGKGEKVRWKFKQALVELLTKVRWVIEEEREEG
jgi:hypothetical protein